jgi:hypothetical protein
VQFVVVIQNSTSLGTISSFQNIAQMVVVYKNNETYYKDPVTGNITTKDLIILQPRDVYYNSPYEFVVQSTMVKGFLDNTFDVEDAPAGSRSSGTMRFWGKQSCRIILYLLKTPALAHFGGCRSSGCGPGMPRLYHRQLLFLETSVFQLHCYRFHSAHDPHGYL